MSTKRAMHVSLLSVGLWAAMMTTPGAAPDPADWQGVAESLGRPGQLMGPVYRVGLPRTDLHVSVQGVEIKPGYNPRLFYMHFWASDDALTLAQGLRAALDQTNSTKGTSR